jgi:hypothetical protein
VRITSGGAPRIWAALLAGLATFLAAGCGSSASSTAPSSSPTDDGTTPPGQTLALGASATVPYQPVSAPQGATAKYKLRVVVSAMEKGRLSDFKGGRFTKAQEGSTPVYVRFKMTNVGDGNAGSEGNPAVEIEGLDIDGATDQALVLYSAFPRCEYRQPPKPFTYGKTFESCLVFLVPGGIAKTVYTGTEAYVDSPVSWK